MAKKTTKTTRNMKVLEQSGYKYKPTPAIMLKGQWLSEFGFDIATQVQVQCEEGRLIIMKAAQYPETETEQMKVAEKKGAYGRKCRGRKAHMAESAEGERRDDR